MIKRVKIIVITLLCYALMCGGKEMKNGREIRNGKAMKNMNLNIGLKPEVTKEAAEKLNKLLANEYVFYTKVLKYHWNITGPNFIALHKLLDDQYHQILTIIDGIAERVRMIGHTTQATLKEFSAAAEIKEKPGINPSTDEMIAELVADHETLIRMMRNYILWLEEHMEYGSVDFLNKTLEDHEKMAWFLRAHLQ